MFKVGGHRYWVPFASRWETIASRVEAITIRLEAIAIRFLLLVGWRPLLVRFMRSIDP